MTPAFPNRLALALVTFSCAAWAQTPLPVAPMRNVPETFFGTTVDDPYREFEDVKAPAVAAWMKAHSEFATATLKAIPGRDALRAAIERYDSSASARVVAVTRLPGEIYFDERRAPAEDQFKLYMRSGLQGAEKLVFDPQALKKQTGKPHAINYFTPSPNGKLVALGVSAGGSEEAALRVIDTASGRQIGPEIPRAQFGAVSWAPDDREFYFHRMQPMKPGQPATDKYQRSTAVVMKPGGSEASVRTVLRAGADLGSAVTEFAFVDVQPDGRLLGVVSDGVSPDIHVWHTTLAALSAGKAQWRKLFGRDEQVTSFAVAGGQAYALTSKNAPRYKLLAAPLEGFNPATAQVLVP
jgi:prolyl oligopeptidase